MHHIRPLVTSAARGMRIMVAALALGLLAGCASTTMSTYRDPGTTGRSAMGSVAVFAIDGDLGSRQTVETVAVTRLTEATGTRAVRAIDLLPPTRNIPPEEATRILQEAGIEGVLFLVLTDAYSDTYETPGTARTTGFGTLYGNSLYLHSTTTYQRGHTYTRPRTEHELKLVDVRSGQVVWMSTSRTRGNAYAGDGTMADSLARSTVNALLREQLVKPVPQAP